MARTHPSPTADAVGRLRAMIGEALRSGTSDIHFEPSAEAMTVRYRIDGVLHDAEDLELTLGRAMVQRLMVLAELLTYRVDVPQEGRATVTGDQDEQAEARIAIMPTIHGLRAAVRLPVASDRPQHLDDLQLPATITTALKNFMLGDMGMVLICGPAGSGKTTTVYALLRYLVEHQRGISVISLEDPVEQDLPAVTQIQVTPFGQMTYETALRSILRQDPQVLALGEIRDAATAQLAVNAALSGHRLIATMHAADPPGAIGRLLEMGVQPYQIANAMHAAMTQRLLRRRQPDSPTYHGRFPIAELAPMDPPMRQAILQSADVETLRQTLLQREDYQSLAHAAEQAVRKGATDRAEVQRVLPHVTLQP